MNNSINKNNDQKNESSSSISITSVSKSFLQVDTSDVFRELKRKSLQLSSFDSNTLYDGKSELSEIWNISCIKNPNQNNNNYDLHSLFSNIPGDKKISGIDTLSFLEKQENKNMSRRQTEKQINIFKGHRNSIGPTFNIIVNNNNNNNDNNNNNKNDEIVNRKVSMNKIDLNKVQA